MLKEAASGTGAADHATASRSLRLAGCLGQAEAAQAGNRLGLAQAAFAEAMQDARRLRNTKALIRAARGYGTVASKRGDLEGAKEAVELLKRLQPVARSGSDPDGMTAAGGVGPDSKVKGTGEKEGKGKGTGGKGKGTGGKGKGTGGGGGSATGGGGEAVPVVEAASRGGGGVTSAAPEGSSSKAEAEVAAASAPMPAVSDSESESKDGPGSALLSPIEEARMKCLSTELVSGAALIGAVMREGLGSRGEGGEGGGPQSWESLGRLHSLLDRALQGDASCRR